jgi:virulence factor Mce-like protein
MTRRSESSLVASPVVVGAVTVLVTVIAVFVAYNANSGLPFVPSYELKAELPSGAKLVKGNEVRVGGFRVGVVKEVLPSQARVRGKRATALVELKLDKRVEPLARDTEVKVRPRSALGLKYVELTPGQEPRTFAPGETIPLRNASEVLELEDVYSIFDNPTRRAAQGATEGIGDALAGRGASLNGAIEGLRPFLTHLQPVMANLADPDTELDRLFPALGRVTSELAPVAGLQARLFVDMADTFEAVSRDPSALRATIERTPPTLDAAIASFRVQRPFLEDFTEISRDLRPAVQELPRSLPALSSAAQAGRPALRRSTPFNERLEDLNTSLDELFRRPTTLLTLTDLRTALAVSRPALAYLTPYQTVCNYALAWFNQLGRHFAAPVTGGTAELILTKQAHNPGQPHELGSTESSRPADVPAGQDPQTARNAFGHLHALHGQPFSPAVDAQGNADCQAGQFGYLNKLAEDGPYPPSEDPAQGGGNHTVVESNTPGLAGPTFKGLELGIQNVRDVP